MKAFRHKQQVLTLVGVLFLVGTVCVPILTVTGATQSFGVATPQTPVTPANQEQDRLIDKFSRKQAPVEIKVIKNKKNQIKLAQKFSGDDEWLKGLSITLRNVSRKTITYIDIGILFDKIPNQQGKQHPPFYESFIYG